MKLPNQPKVLAATINPITGDKMISFLVDFPTVLLAQVSQHRIIAQLQDAKSEVDYAYFAQDVVNENKSANSARAIPHNKYLQKVLDNPFVPIWTKQQKGMSGELIKSDDALTKNWLYSLEGFNQGDSDEDFCILKIYKLLLTKGVHKQNANRLLAPFAYTTCILSGTEWDNFFELRCPKYHTPVTGEGFYAKSKKELISWHSNSDNLEKLQDPNFDWQSINTSSAQPEFQVIAEMLYDLYQETNWKTSKYHIPFEEDILNFYGKEYLFDSVMEYVSNEEFEALTEEERINLYIKHDVSYYELLMKISASMCAKLSYNTQDNEDTIEKHLERAEMLLTHKHWEPFSHQAIAMDSSQIHKFTTTFMMSPDKYALHKKTLGQHIALNYTNIMHITKLGVAYNLRGFYSQRFKLENLA